MWAQVLAGSNPVPSATNMFIEVQQLLEDKYELGPIRDICVVAAQRTYLRRKDTDTNPLIVQMKVHGALISHWYYRSNEWVDQPYFMPRDFVQPYRGPANSAYPWLYGNDTYEIDEQLKWLTDNGFFDEEFM